MKKLILLLFLTFGLFSFNNAPPKLKLAKIEKFRLNKNQLKMSQKLKSSVFEIKDGYVFPAKGFLLFGGKNAKGGMITFFVKQSSELSKKPFLEGELLPYFVDLTTSADFGYYCSCGSNISDSDGDDCELVEKEGNTSCGGTCTGDNEGRECSFTGVVWDTGVVTSTY